MSVTTGNVNFDQTDAVVPGVAAQGLRFIRSYNSANAEPGRYGVFGPGWSHSYEKKISHPGAPPVTSVLLLREGNGVPKYFHLGIGSQTYQASVPFDERSSIQANPDGTWERKFRGGGSERYASLTDPNVALRGRLIAIVDPAGNTTSLSHNDSQGRVTGILDPGLRQLTLTYVSAAQIELSGPAGLIATYFMTPEGRLDRVEYGGAGGADGAFAFAYDGATPRLITVSDGSGRIVETHDYDGTGRGTTSAISGNVEKVTLDYSEPLQTTVTDALGNVTTYEYKSIWGSTLVTKIIGPCSGCGGGGGDTQEWTYDTRGRVATYRDGVGNLTSYVYDEATSDLLSETRTVAVGTATHVTSYTYYGGPDPGAGRVHTVTRPNGAVTTFVYGPAGPTSITEQAGPGSSRTTTIQYFANGKPEKVFDPRGKEWGFSFLPSGDLESVRDPLGIPTGFTYDLMGRRTQVIRPPSTPPDPPIQEPITAYDTVGRVKRVTQPDDATYTEFTYDGGGRRTKVRDPLGRVTDYIYDLTYGRLDRVKDAKLGETVFGYDLMSNLTSLADARGGTTGFEYDGHNRVWKVLRVDDGSNGLREVFTYDAAGRLQTKQDLRLIATTYTYDGLGRLTGKSYSDGTPAVTFSYDENGVDQKGRLTSATAGSITLRWTYNWAGEALTAVRQKGASIRTLAYGYDAAGNRLNLSLDGANLLTYAWDDRGLLDVLTRAPGRIFDFSYDAASRRKTLAFPNGVTTSYGYDQRSRLSKVEAVGQSIVSQFTYPSHDALDNRTSRAGTTAPAEGYGYDELYRLLTVTRGTPPQPAESYTYDATGNRLTMNGVPGWTYNLQNRLTAKPNATFMYDFDGNLTHKFEGADTWQYEWDAEKRLTRVRKNSVDVATYVYDALGRRAERVFGASNLEEYIYDGEDILLSEFTSGGIPEGPLFDMTNHLYVHGPGVDEPLEVYHGTGDTWFYHADGLGSVVRVTDEDGLVVPSMSRQYDAFGNPEVGTAQEGYAFTGREWDPETGLYYYRARYYDPKLGRFVSEDPIGLVAGINFYSYVDNDPINRTDPAGLASRRSVCILAHTLAGAAAGGKMGAAGGATVAGVATGGTLALPGGGVGGAGGAFIGGTAGLIGGLFSCPPDDTCPDTEKKEGEDRCTKVRKACAASTTGNVGAKTPANHRLWNYQYIKCCKANGCEP